LKKKRNRYRSDRRRLKEALRLWIKAAACLGATAVLLVLLSAGLSHSYYALLDAPWLRADEIDISGLKHLDRDEVIEALGVPKNTGLLNLRVSQLALRIEALPQVESVVVRLDLPRRIVVEIVEREPVAILKAEEHFLLDRNGRLFASATPGKYPGLHLLTGFSGLGLTQGDVLPAETLESLAELLPALEKAKGWLSSLHLSECRWHSGGVVLYGTSGSLPIQLGTKNFDEKLERLQGVFKMLKDRRWLDGVTRIDMDYSNRAYIEGHFPVLKGS